MELVDGEHLMNCNSMRHLEFLKDRQAFVAQCVLEGLDMRCLGPRPGLMHPICQLPETSKRAIDSIVRPIMRERTRNIN